MYIDTWRSGGLRHGDVSAPAARRMVRTLVWPPLPHRTLANIGPLCSSLSFSSSLPCPPPFLAFSLSLAFYSPSVSLATSLGSIPGHLGVALSRA